MGAHKRFLEEVAAELGTEDITDAEVVAAAQRRLDHELMSLGDHEV
ncbi:MAG: hypothetical protein HY673_03600 [Chloroflexi bacterium]|nr:hypothetical protein [Chloroflexota bacterium]